MIRRVMYLSFHPDPERVAAWHQACLATPQKVPGVLAWAVGKLERRDDEFAYMVEGLFRDIPAVEAYVKHAYHVEILNPFFTASSPTYVGKRADVYHYEPAQMHIGDRGLKRCRRVNYTLRSAPGAAAELEALLPALAGKSAEAKNWAFGRTTQAPSATAWTHVLECELAPGAAGLPLALPRAPRPCRAGSTRRRRAFWRSCASRICRRLGQNASRAALRGPAAP